jgi:hypothetical protein
MATTKAQRRLHGKAAAARRASNTLADGQRQEDPHQVDHLQDSRETEQDVLASYGVNREADSEPWVRPNQLYAPEPRPGYTQRWVRIRLGNTEDVNNSSRKFREGWLPRRPDTVPKGDLPPTSSHPRLGDIIGVEDLILCEMPVNKAKQRNAFYRARIDRMVEGIENDINTVSKHGPRIDKVQSTKVSKRRRRIPDDPTED